MGEVYLAKDRHLERKVAIKLLRKKFVNNEAGLRRFVLEAKAASALNHPNIITIYEIGRSDDSQYIATEYIEGHTLHKLLASGGLDLDEILNITIQVAEALNAAHNAGIVHRDIKPENIMVRKDGYVKVLDFGLAKLLDHDDVPIDVTAKTQKMFETNPGVIMGTVSYMSPEQARGKAVDTRSDIWSLGVVLFQMLTGRLPFTGETTSDVIAALLKAPIPKLGDCAPDTPKELERVVDKALRRDREERYQNIKDLLIDLKDLKQELNLSGSNGHRTERQTGFFERPATTGNGHVGSSTLKPPSTARTHSISDLFLTQFRIHPKIMVGALACIFLVIAFAAIGMTRWMTSPSGSGNFDSMRLSKLTYSGNAEGGNIAVSPDGKQIAYTVQGKTGRSLWLKQMEAGAGTEIIPPADVAYRGLTFSPKGDYIYYSVVENTGASEIRRMPVSGGEAQRVVSAAQGRISFSPNGDKFAFIRDDVAMLIADADGGNVKRVAVCKGGTTWWMPSWSPHGDKIVAALYSPDDSAFRLVEVSVDDGSQRDISPSRWLTVFGIAWLPDNSGLILIGRDPETQFSQLWRMSYPSGELRRITNDMSSYLGLSLTSNAAAAVTVQENRVANIWVAPEANPASMQKITTEVGRDEGLSGIAWTPDGRIVYTTRLAARQDLWIVDRDGRNNRQLTVNAKSNFSPAVTPDGHSIVFISDREGRLDLWKMDLDGSNPVRLTDTVDTEAFPDVSPDGKWIVYQVEDEHNRSTIWKLPINGGTPVKLTNVQSGWPRVSPDGKYIACIYGQDEITARKDAAIIPFNGGEPIKMFKIPTANFRWSTDGRSISYLSNGIGTHGLRSISTNGNDVRDLADFGTDSLFRFDISKYGIALARGSETSDVVMISNFK